MNIIKLIFISIISLFSVNVFPCTHADCGAPSSGSGAYVLQNSPTINTPVLGSATFTSIVMSGNASPFCSSTAPTLSGFGTSPSVANNAGTCAFTINVGTGGTASTGTINLPAAVHGWVCSISDLTTPNTLTTQSGAGTTTTVPITNYILTTGIAGAWAASDVLAASCHGY